MTDPPSGATGLLAGAISYTLGVCALVGPGEMALPTPCADWNLGMLLAHLSDSMADLETAIRTGNLDLERPPDHAVGDPVEILRDRAAELLCAAFSYSGPEHFVAVGGLPVPAGLVACTGAVEIAVHGWDVSAALGRASRGEAGCGGVRPIPAGLATRMLRLGPLLVAGREGLFAVPVDIPAQASPGDRLVGYLGRRPR
ncbi:MAG: TIGR03086 family metal-binding protein [Streptosporangiaceae bacterium]